MELQKVPTRYYPKRHAAPVPVENGNSWQNDGQNYVWDKKNNVYRTWALGNPTWYPNQPMFVETGWISYKGEHLDSLKPDDTMFIVPGNGPADTLWSGSCYVDWENHLGRGKGHCYYYISAPEPNLQAIQLLVADELGATPYDLGMCISPDQVPMDCRDGGRNFRDCRVFWDDDHNQLVLAATDGEGFIFYTSLDGVHWIPTGSMKGPGPLVECPNLYKLPVYDVDGNDTGSTKWTILGAVQGGYPGGSQSNECVAAWIGDWDGNTFTPDTINPQPLDYGPDSYATAAGLDKDGKPVVGFWIGNWAYCLQPMPYVGFQNIQSLPRKTWIAPDNTGTLRVYNYLLDNDGDNYDTTVKGTAQTIGGYDGPYQWDSEAVPTGECYRLDVKLNQINNEWPQQTLIRLRSGNISGQDFGTDFIYDGATGSLSCDRSNAGLDYPNSPNPAPTTWERICSTPASLQTNAGTSVDLTFIVDSSSVEVFINGGQTSFTTLTFPPEGCEGLAIEASDPVLVTTALSKYKGV